MNMYDRIDGFTNAELQSAWDALQFNYDPKIVVDNEGHTTDEWAMTIKSEMEKRGLPKTKRIQITFRGCQYIAEVVLNSLSPIRTTNGLTIPGLEGVQAYITDDTDMCEWVRVASRNHPTHKFNLLTFDKPVVLKGMNYAGSPFEENQQIARCHSLDRLKEIIEGLHEEFPEVKNLKVFGGTDDDDTCLNGIYTVNQIVKEATKLVEW